MNDTLTIDSRYCGPPNSANGGYACGLLAARLGVEAQVTLRSPPPLDTPLAVDKREDGALRLLQGERLIAEAQPFELSAHTPAPVSIEAAEMATRSYPWTEHHPFATCFVCGPERTAGDGLRIFPGPVAGREIVAAPWTPDPGLSDAKGHVRSEFVWAALDCPSWFGAVAFHPELQMGLLAQLAVRVITTPRVGEHCVITGWVSGIEGRKIRAGSALFTEDGRLAGFAQALWIHAP